MAIFAFGVVVEDMVLRLNLVLNSVSTKDTTNSFFKKEGYKYKNKYVKEKRRILSKHFWLDYSHWIVGLTLSLQDSTLVESKSIQLLSIYDQHMQFLPRD